MPAWSGDGSKLAFDVRLPSGSEIWMIETGAAQGPQAAGASWRKEVTVTKHLDARLPQSRQRRVRLIRDASRKETA